MTVTGYCWLYAFIWASFAFAIVDRKRMFDCYEWLASFIAASIWPILVTSHIIRRIIK